MKKVAIIFFVKGERKKKRKKEKDAEKAREKEKGIVIKCKQTK